MNVGAVHGRSFRSILASCAAVSLVAVKTATWVACAGYVMWVVVFLVYAAVEATRHSFGRRNLGQSCRGKQNGQQELHLRKIDMLADYSSEAMEGGEDVVGFGRLR